MLILMCAYGEGHLIGTQIALAATLAAAPDLERVGCVNRHCLRLTSTVHAIRRPVQQILFALRPSLWGATNAVRVDADGLSHWNDMVGVALGASGSGVVGAERADNVWPRHQMPLFCILHRY